MTKKNEGKFKMIMPFAVFEKLRAACGSDDQKTKKFCDECFKLVDSFQGDIDACAAFLRLQLLVVRNVRRIAESDLM